ncbi:MAG TPA: DUF3748 domain-containing protein [Methylomirabilota bacterium]|nr:DUF3748 domain-containing protein [Methylomirabilota bacterium]
MSLISNHPPGVAPAKARRGLHAEAGTERQITHAPHGHVLTNTAVWSPDGRWIVYDVRSDPAGEVFDGARIEMVNVETGEVRRLFEARNGAHCGVATFNPVRHEVVFILGPEHPTSGWTYGPSRRQGVLVATVCPGRARNLDARDLTPPFTPGALRGGSHVHVFDGAGEWVSFTYEDEVLNAFREETPDRHINLRNVGVSMPRAVTVKKDHPRNHDGDYFSVLVTRTTARPRPGSDEIRRACEESWIGRSGYRPAPGGAPRRALAFQGHVVTAAHQVIAEAFLVELPDDVTVPGDGPLAGTATQRPAPPRGTVQRRLTFTAHRRHPGLQGPRHWLHSSPAGDRIGLLMKDDDGIVQFWTVSPQGGPPEQITRNPWPVASSFSWSPDGRHVAFVMDNSVCVAEVATGRTRRLTPRSDDASAPRPEACVFAPDGRQVAYVRRVPTGEACFNQIFICEFHE